MPQDEIIYRNIESPLGDMIAGTRHEGICFLEWHDRGGVPRILERVAKRYKLPLKQGEHKYLTQLESELKLYFEGKLKNFKVPVAVNGTAFEMKTWQHLLKIPYGAQSTYGEMAKRLGKPGASRAVGRANGANYLSIVIPCHRVVEKGGGLRGYGGGLKRKKWLLNLEADENGDLTLAV
jgi:AraC family transcriptional regulator of adaptative response/methylated-DNA-[protein]-cysteine methyltransferase